MSTKVVFQVENGFEVAQVSGRRARLHREGAARQVDPHPVQASRPEPRLAVARRGLGAARQGTHLERPRARLHRLPRPADRRGGIEP
jgi:hypothetical protein